MRADPPRLVACDLDGTVLRSDGTISPRTAAALDRIEAAGARYVFVTGRRPRYTEAVLGPFGYQGTVICVNGALTYDMGGGGVTAQQLIQAGSWPRRRPGSPGGTGPGIAARVSGSAHAVRAGPASFASASTSFT